MLAPYYVRMPCDHTSLSSATSPASYAPINLRSFMPVHITVHDSRVGVRIICSILGTNRRSGLDERIAN